MVPDPSKTIFSTRYNFLKIYVNDSTTLSIADTFNGVSYNTATYLLYAHNLGYIPRARVFYEPVSGQLWPMTAAQYAKTNGGTGTQINIFGSYHLTTTGLYVDVKNITGSTQAVSFYYRIYLDE